MGSSIGRLALGVVGALIAPVGFAAMGFAIGSAVGSLIFPPEGPTVEGPKISDTSVTASSLGKTIEWHVGTVRTSGNVIWSAGLREKKKKEKVRSGGKGGGGGSTQISYQYFASFAISFGYQPGADLKRIWADGKLIFDVDRVQGKHKDLKFRFVRGGESTPVDPLIAESIHRRLAGMDDVNKGNQKQKEYKDITEIIGELQEDASPRAQIYAQRLQAVKDSAEGGGGVPDYRFTPAYKDLCYIVFDNLPLADFANRIPNITAEIEFDVQTPEGVSLVANTFEIGTISAGTPSGGLAGIDHDNQFMLVDTGGDVRKFDSFSITETARNTPDANVLSVLAINQNSEALVVDTVGHLHILNTNSMERIRSLTDPADWSFLTDFDPYSDRILASRFPRKKYDEDDPQGSISNSFLVFTDDRICLMASATKQTTYNQIQNGGDGDNDNRYTWMDGVSNLPFGGKEFGLTTTRDVHFVHDTVMLGNDGYTKVGAFSIPYKVGNTPTLITTRFSGTSVQLVRISLARVTRGITAPVDSKGTILSNILGTEVNLVSNEYGQTYYVDSDNNAILPGWTGTFGGETYTTQTQGYTIDGLNYGIMINLDLTAQLGGATIEDVSFLNYDFVEETYSESDSDVVGLFAGLPEQFSKNPDGSFAFPTFGDGRNPFAVEGGTSNDVSGVTDVSDLPEFQMLLRLSDGTGAVYSSASGLTRLPLPPPPAQSGYAASVTSNAAISYAHGRDFVDVYLRAGSYQIFEDALDTDAASGQQIFVPTLRALMTWVDGQPVLIKSGAAGAGLGGARSLSAIITFLCAKAGIGLGEIDTLDLIGETIRGMTVARKSSFRQVIEILLDARACDGVEAEWMLKFSRKHSTVSRRIHETLLQTVGDEDNPSNFVETRRPEYDLPREIQLTFVDPDRDYETNSVQARRPSAPISTMDSVKQENLEVPLVMYEHEAKELTEKALFKKWMQRDSSKFGLPWTHIDLDPTDVVEIEFDDGTILTERIERTMIGANFEIEFDGVRNSDPVFEAREIPQVNNAALPRQPMSPVVPSTPFVFDIPALEDFHATVGVPQLYGAVGASSEQWVAASVFRSFDGSGYESVTSFNSDIVWGVVSGALGAPRSYWTTDTENSLTIFPMNDEGEIVSVTREEVLSGANRALIWNTDEQEGEIIAFQDAEVQSNGSVILTNLLRGLRGTEYFADQHDDNEQFFLLDDTRMARYPLDIGRLNSNTFWKAVSTGQIIGEAMPLALRPKGRDLAPWAPSRVRRVSDGSGGITLTWNRRARIGGQWNTSASVEAAPIIEPTIGYNIWILRDTQRFGTFDPGRPTTFLTAIQTDTTTTTLTASDLAELGIAEGDTIKAVIQQIGNYAAGFYGRHILAP